ncbi:MAG TPA: YerC/YecD family TrpR-related protein [Steroidobacteraceae bacterium]|nr:YerC/YecD family TrpR-related protein [Steroidobacteraceae bacterium]
MKAHRLLSARQEAQAERSLLAALLTLRSLEECRAFLRDLCTPAEIQAMADRWAVVEGLRRGLPYRRIHRQTGVSLTTIGRVARYLAQGNGGYRLAAQRIDGERHALEAHRGGVPAPRPSAHAARPPALEERGRPPEERGRHG